MTVVAVLTRAEGENERGAALLAERGIPSIEAPMLRFEALPPDPDLLRKIAGIEADLLLTSREATMRWLDLRRRELPSWRPRRSHVVGAGSGALLEDAGEPVATIGSDADDLFHRLPPIDRLLYPCSAERLDLLPTALSARGTELLELPLYRPHPPAAPSAALLELLGDPERRPFYLFLSPSAVRNFFSLGVEPGRGAIFSAIGPTTAAELAQHGITEVVMPERPELADLADAIARRLAT